MFHSLYNLYNTYNYNVEPRAFRVALDIPFNPLFYVILVLIVVFLIIIATRLKKINDSINLLNESRVGRQDDDNVNNVNENNVNEFTGKQPIVITESSESAKASKMPIHDDTDNDTDKRDKVVAIIVSCIMVLGILIAIISYVLSNR